MFFGRPEPPLVASASEGVGPGSIPPSSSAVSFGFHRFQGGQTRIEIKMIAATRKEMGPGSAEKMGCEEGGI